MDRRAVRSQGGLLRAGCAVALLGAVLPASPLVAAETGIGVTAGVGHSDNIRRSDGAEQSESIGQLGVNFSVFQQSRRVNADITGDFSWLNYFDDQYDDEVVGSFLGDVKLGIVPDRFEWQFADTFGQATTQPFVVVTPDNRENINYFTTGPDLIFGMGRSARVKLQGRYTNVAYESAPLDNDRVSGEGSLIHDFSSASSLSLNARFEQTDFDDNTLNTDFDNTQAFVRYQATLSRTQVGVELGYTEVELDAASGGVNSGIDSSMSGVLARIEVSRRMSPSSTLSAALGREISNSGDIFRQLQQLQSAQVGTQPVQLSSDPFTSQYGTLAWSFSRNRTGFGLSVSRFEEEYQVQTALNRNRTVFGSYFNRQMTPSLNFQLSAVQNRESYDVLGNQDFRELYGTATLAYQIGRRFSLDLQYERSDRSSDLPGGDYTENRGWIRLHFFAGESQERSSALPTGLGGYR